MNSITLKFKPSVCGWTNQTDCKVCGKWTGFWYVGYTSDHQRQLNEFKLAQQKQHNELWYKQLDCMKIV